METARLRDGCSGDDGDAVDLSADLADEVGKELGNRIPHDRQNRSAHDDGDEDFHRHVEIGFAAFIPEHPVHVRRIQHQGRR